jgi:C4-type Zn-finger protein
MCIFHKWGKWTQYESKSIEYFLAIPFISSSIRQTRACEKCGYTQDRFVRSQDLKKIKSVEFVKEDL